MSDVFFQCRTGAFLNQCTQGLFRTASVCASPSTKGAASGHFHVGMQALSRTDAIVPVWWEG